MLSSDKERDMEKLSALWESFKGLITETEERKRIVNSIISNFETNQLKGQVRKLNSIYTSIASDARLFILLILSQFNAFHYELEFILSLFVCSTKPTSTSLWT
ncbi:unnamed protein product [marine sediment metagenome]|uniref:Uncharacterized protein n=1 Tax=marine sediment metagenome TaxID=412755 RepID=X1AK32_9ZZZZ